MGETPTHKVLAQMIRDVATPVGEALKPFSGTLEGFIFGYSAMQMMTTFNKPGAEAMRKIVDHFGDKFKQNLSTRGADTFLEVGICGSVLQDIAAVAGSINYLAGSDEQLAKASAFYVGGKLVLNAVSLAGYGIYRWYQSATNRVQEETA